MECIEICQALGCYACQLTRRDAAGKKLESVYLGWDCSAVREYHRWFGDRATDFDVDIFPIHLQLLFPRDVDAQPVLVDVAETHKTYAEAMAAAHDRMVANYDENAERAKARAARYDPRPQWLREKIRRGRR